MSISSARIHQLQHKVWSGSIPLEIRLDASDCRTYSDSDPYLIQLPRVSYLPFILLRLHAFFTPILISPKVEAHEVWLSFEGVPLKWHYPVGLLYDLFSGAEPISLDERNSQDGAASHVTVQTAIGRSTLPWRLTVHYSDYPGDQLIPLDAEGRAILDSYINSVKEAGFIRHGTARTVMSLSKDDSDNLWHAVQTHNLMLFNTINTKLLDPPGMELRHVPIKVYLPTSAAHPSPDTISEEGRLAGHMRVVQSLVPVHTSTKQPQTVGTALNTILPTIFPSRRNPLLAQPVLHGAVLPMRATLGDLNRAAAYPDGFLHLVIVMLA